MHIFSVINQPFQNSVLAPSQKSVQMRSALSPCLSFTVSISAIHMNLGVGSSVYFIHTGGSRAEGAGAACAGGRH